MENEITVNPEYSAQSSIGKPNPFVLKSINYIFESKIVDFNWDIRVADQGCGKLRHFKILKSFFRTIYLIDTEFQLNKRQKIFGRENTTIREYISSLSLRNNDITVLSNLEFGTTKLDLDIVFNICVFDVVLPGARDAMISEIMSNLKRDGLFILIIPRNDQSILKRCLDKYRYQDGFLFRRGKISTFYRNFRNTEEIIDKIKRKGFEIKADLSRYRQICLIMEKSGR